MADTKYACFKAHDFISARDDASDEAKQVLQRLQNKRLHDSVVIRLQDRFAPPALDAYANSITIAIETLDAAGIDGEVVDRLKKVADYFHERAAESWQRDDRKLPD